jgi:hypothetical protein
MSVIDYILISLAVIAVAYFVGAAFASGLSNGIERFLNKHFEKYTKFKNDKENGTKTSK